VPDEGALAPVFAPVPELSPAAPGIAFGRAGGEVVSTGFPDLDAVLGPGGLVREANLTLRGGDSSGKTTLALRLVAEAQRQGAIAAYLDLARSLDPLEAVARGVDLDWLIVLRSADAIEGLQLAGALLGGRTVEMLVVDLPARLPANGEEILRRLAARARRAGVQLVAIEPSSLVPSLRGALAETAGVGLGLECRSWIRVGRDVVGQRTLVTVEKNRFGPPGRRVELEIRYVEDGARGRAIARALESRDRRSDGAGARVLFPGSGDPGSAAPVHAALSVHAGR
jgi:recombination protein RecA